MEPRRDPDDLSAALRSLRPTPRGEFAAELDARAAAGFPRDAQAPASVLSRIAERFRTTPPLRMLAPAGAVALTAIVVATAVVTTEDRSTSSRLADSDVQYSAAPQAEPQDSAGGAASAAGAIEMLPNPSGNHAASFERREIERSAQIVLGTDPDRVRADAAKVFDAVHAVDGIVLRSAIRDGASGEAGAEFELLIPSARLGDAMADFSAIGEVRSRRESTQDITAPTIGARERLRDSRATIEGLLNQLAAATTDAERAATEAKLRAERRQAAFFASQLDRLDRRANLSRVSLRIETGSAAASEDGGGAWGAGDGLDDAGRLLEIAAGVTIIGLAVLTPLALLALLGWLAHRAWIRAGRRRVLGQTG
jgi:hypothetical protein